MTSTPSVQGPSGSNMGRMERHSGDDRPLFLLNLKAYEGTFGKHALEIGRLLEGCGREYSVRVAIAPSTPFLASLASQLSIPVLAQHTDPLPPGAKTGRTVAAAIREAGAWGSLVNHSEHIIEAKDVAAVVSLLEENSLVPVVCAGSSAIARDLAALCKPAFIAVEPPELIGGDVSVSVAKPEIVSNAVESVKKVSPKTRVLCGAGVKSQSDVRRSLELGAEGVLVASAVATAKDPKSAIEELLKGF